MGQRSARPPVEIIERECGHRSGSQTEPDQETNDGGIAQAQDRPPVGRLEEALDLIWLKGLRQPRQPPAGHRRHAVREIALDIAADEKENARGTAGP